ncbi:gp63 domain protein [Burkholderia pseudomallei]|uniref:hypothetical protein n=1 Tax=Burkholderia pseudomallei TaxID=28450 RepID=UPI00050FF361|nr:hypothetical protein [Burkholderia pseudomallei]KGC66688.1 gp63 domain protein [Burkholderia pseudomallei]
MTTDKSHAGALTDEQSAILIACAYRLDEVESLYLAEELRSVMRALLAAAPVVQHAAASIGQRWIAFTDAMPPVQENGRGDRARRKVLVTNNINARDAFGDPSHVWIGSPAHDKDDGWRVPDGGKFLTHWMDPFATSANETGAEGANDLAHELWAAAQLAPSEGIEDGVRRLVPIVSRSPATAAAAPADERIAQLEASVLRYQAMVDELKQRLHDVTHSDAPADERAALPRYAEWLHLRTHGEWSNGVPEWARDYTGRMNDFTAATAVIEELAARAAASPAAEAREPDDETIVMWARDNQREPIMLEGERFNFNRAELLAFAGCLRRAYAAPQPAQADAPAKARERERIGTVEIVDGRVRGYTFEQTDTPTGSYNLYTGPADAPAEAREPIAWVTDDDRAITAAQKQRALADGGATASSVRPYSIPCYLCAVRAPAAESVAIYQILTEDGAWLDTTREYYERVKGDPALARVVYADSQRSAPSGARQGLTTAHAGGDQ